MVDWVLDALQAEIMEECLAKMHGALYVFVHTLCSQKDQGKQN
jgi:hypothetical protein